MVVFKEERTKWTALISCLDKARCTILGMSCLYKCGVLDVICLLPGFTTTSLEQMKSTPHFLFYITTRVQELGWTTCLYGKENLESRCLGIHKTISKSIFNWTSKNLSFWSLWLVNGFRISQRITTEQQLCGCWYCW